MICKYVILVIQNYSFKLPKYAKPSSKTTLGGNMDGMAKFRGLDVRF
jgi:hypothetical protein